MKPMNVLRSVLPALLAAAALPAPAQFGNPAGLLPGTVEAQPGVPAPGQANTADRLFVKLVGAGNAGEIELARLAEGRAGSDATRGFARRMVQDHGAAAERLAAAARPLNLRPPAQIDPDQAAAKARLEGLRGAAFDIAYLQAQLVDHQKTATLLQWQIANGQDAGLQAFAKETLPAVTEHLRMTQELLAELTGAGARSRAAGPASARAR